MLFTIELFTVGAGTAVSFLFTSYADLFFSEALLSTGRRRKFGLSLERRVLTFPSGSLREFDLELLMGMGLGCCLGTGIRFPV